MNIVKKKVIFSAVVGNYDTILQPKIIDEDFDYILFSNDILDDNVGIWKVRRIPYSNDDKTRVARYVKTHPEELLRGYKHTVWMDANIQVVSSKFYDILNKVISDNVIISSFWHNERNCVYEEIAAVVYTGVEEESVAVKWLNKLIKEKYPRKNGLYETNLVYRNIDEVRIRHFDMLWWRCIDNYSRRDQLSFNYSLWKLDISCPFFLGDKQNARNSELLNYTKHSGGKNRNIYGNQSIMLRYYKLLYATYSQSTITKLTNVQRCIYESHFVKILLCFYGLFYRTNWIIRRMKMSLQ